MLQTTTPAIPIALQLLTNPEVADLIGLAPHHPTTLFPSDQGRISTDCGQLLPADTYLNRPLIRILLQAGCKLHHLRVWYPEYPATSGEDRGWAIDRVALELPNGIQAAEAVRLTRLFDRLGTRWGDVIQQGPTPRIILCSQFGPAPEHQAARCGPPCDPEISLR